MTDAAVTTRIHDNGWAELILNRPDRKNAINGPLGEALAAGAAELSNNEAVNAIVFRGAGGAFCSGLDLKEFNADPAPDWHADFQSIWRGAHRALFQCSKPIVGALERYAINGGAALALACDVLVVGKNAFVQVGEIQIGMAAPYNLAWMSLRHSESIMARVALLGERLSGETLAELGLAQYCVPDDAVLARAEQLAQQIGGYPASGVGRIKAGLRARLDGDADAWFDRFTGVDPVGARVRPSSMSDRS